MHKFPLLCPKLDYLKNHITIPDCTSYDPIFSAYVYWLVRTKEYQSSGNYSLDGIDPQEYQHNALASQRIKMMIFSHKDFIISLVSIFKPL